MGKGAPDAELVHAAVGGDRSALERALLSVHDRLAGELRLSVPPDARGILGVEDVLQEAYVDAFRGIRSFQPNADDPVGSFYRWLVTIAEHRLLDMLKARRAAKRGGGRVQVDAIPNANGAGAGAAAPGGANASVLRLLDVVAVDEHTPSRSAARREAASAIHVAMAGLKQEYRDALRMRYIEGLSVAEVAAKLGRSEGAVQMLCHRALHEMRAAMGRASGFLTIKP
jgi:RNA polymerase sigma-70 factor (ECF subfamily)